MLLHSQYNEMYSVTDAEQFSCLLHPQTLPCFATFYRYAILLHAVNVYRKLPTIVAPPPHIAVGTRLELIILFLVPIILFLHSHKIPLLFSLKYRLFSLKYQLFSTKLLDIP